MGPAGPATVDWRYEPETNVLETDWETASGGLRVTDLMPLAHAAEGWSCLLRRAECTHGQVEVAVELVPTPDYARSPAQITTTDGGWTASGGGQVVRLSVGPDELAVGPASTAGNVDAESIVGRFSLRAGEFRWVVLTAGGDATPPTPTPAEADEALASTRRDWRAWSARGRYEGPYADVLRRSALLLRLLMHTPSGALVAAPTTSLPEDPGGVRNWDYRFCWLRDAAWIADALMGLGYHDESMAFIGWLEARALADAVPPILYAVDGARPAEELELPHLAGWRGSRPVRTGNAAAAQRQNDVFGEIVEAIYICSEGMPSMRPLRPELWKVVVRLADAAAERWSEPDRGMWEVRGPSRPFFTSRLFCWVALDRALRMARRDGLGAADRLARWEAARDGAGRTLLEDGFHRDTGAFTWIIGEPGLGADPLLAPRAGLLPADDPRMTATVARIAERLAERGLLRRYVADDGLPGRKGAFGACSFWWVEALALARRLGEAHELFRRIIGYASDLGLFSEEIDPATGELLGNLPQGFTHLALVRAALTLEQVERGPGRPGSR